MLSLSKMRWPSLAQDLAVMSVPGSPIEDLKTVLATYDLSQDDLKNILKTPEFLEMFERELQAVRAEGSRAAANYRYRTLSQSLSEKLFRDATTGTMEAKDAIKLLELLFKASDQFAKEAQPQVNTQVNVGVQLPLPTGLANKKLAHAIPIQE